MNGVAISLQCGLFAEVTDDWRILVVESDPRHVGVYYLGSYPYDADGHPLHSEAPAVLNVWDQTTPGARQISDRQKRIAHFTSSVIFEADLVRLHA